MIKGTAELLLDTNAVLGEGPVWDWKKQQLFWVDIEGTKLHRYDPKDGKHRFWDFEQMIGAAVPDENGTFLLAMESGLATFDPDSGKLAELPVLQNSNTAMRYNDGKVDPQGRFWIGSMHKQVAPETGAFYCVDADWNVSEQISKTTISNGMAWTSDQRWFYYIDTANYEVWRFTFHPETGDISNKEVAFSVPKSYGGPDGMCIDSDDMLWIAHWGGHCVRRWDPNTGSVLEQVTVPAPHVTSCCFGGEHLDTLYITTAKSGLDDTQRTAYPKSGGLFTYVPKTGGTPIHYFKKS